MRNSLITPVIITSLLSQGCHYEEKEAGRPNILFIMTDDHAMSAISAYDGFLAQVAPTPNIDRIARDGALLENMFCTNSISGPSRASILTGNYSHVHGFYKNEGGGDFDGSQQTFPKLFQKAGYQTVVIGKWHLGTSPTGFDYYKVLYNKEGQGSYFDPVFEESGGGLIEEKGKYSTTVIKEDALNWLKKHRDKKKPFMLMVQFKAPHRPWDPGPGYQNYLAGIEIPHPANFNDNYQGRTAAKDAWMRIDGHLNRKDLKITPPAGLTGGELEKWNSYGNNGEFWTPDSTLSDAERKDWKYQHFIKDYLRCVKAADDAIGEVLDFLDESGLADNTVVVYTSDQGFFLGEHGWFDKRFMYEESFHMPCLIRFPKHIEPGTINNDLLLNIDYAPTLLDAAGIPIPGNIQGKSFLPLLKEKNHSPFRDAVYYHYYEYPFWHHVQPHYGIRTGRYKLIHFYYNIDEWEFYDLVTDPGELHNLYGIQAYDSIIEAMKIRLDNLKKETKMDKTMDELREMTDVQIKGLYKVETPN
ncbi:MAG: sulfatase [Bacteroidales bacterium]|jgi:arylsulfatase A-like enzyme|nr:sulfatase [Bacteroidales bacterium]